MQCASALLKSSIFTNESSVTPSGIIETTLLGRILHPHEIVVALRNSER
jgi:hypothetical protein